MSTQTRCRFNLLSEYLWIAVCAVVLSLVALPRGATAQSDEIAPPKSMEVLGVPKAPSSLAKEVKRYMGAYGLPLAGWHPEKRELWVKGISSATWVARVETPAGPQKPWIYLPFGDVYDVYFQPQAKYAVYNRDANGDESFQMFLYNPATRASTPLSEEKSRNTEPVWSHSGERVVWSFSQSKASGVSLAVINPFDPKSRRLLVESTGNYLKAFGWSPDDTQVAFCEFIGNTTSRLWLVDVEKGEKRLLSGNAEKADEYYDSPLFSRDGKGLFVITDRGSNVRRLAYLNLSSGQFKSLTPAINWDVDEFQLSPDGKTLAFVVNENGVSRLYLLDTEGGDYKPAGDLPIGVISDLKWHNNSTDLAFNLKSPRTPNDVYSLDAKTGKVELWTKSVNGGLDLEKLPLPELIQWKSFDGRMISGFLYRPATGFTGKRPVIIDIHGGPEEQYRPVFGYEDNYFINELGIVKIYPRLDGIWNEIPSIVPIAATTVGHLMRKASKPDHHAIVSPIRARLFPSRLSVAPINNPASHQAQYSIHTISMAKPPPAMRLPEDGVTIVVAETQQSIARCQLMPGLSVLLRVPTTPRTPALRLVWNRSIELPDRSAIHPKQH